jgi:hypothetical protein
MVAGPLEITLKPTLSSAMKSRQVCFYVDRSGLWEMMDAVEERVIPNFEALPHFLGITVIKADAGTRCEVVVTTYWDEGLEGSEEQSALFVEEIARETGRNPSRKAFDTLYARVRDSAGQLRLSRNQWDGRPRHWPDDHRG